MISLNTEVRNPELGIGVLEESDTLQKKWNVDTAIQSLFLKGKNNSSIPYTIINYISKKYLKLVVPTVLREVHDDYHNRSETKLTTSCVNTAFTVAAIFVGLKKAKEIAGCFRIDPSFKIDCTLPSGMKWQYTVCNVFSGIALCNMRKEKMDLKTLNSKYSTPNALPYIKTELDVFFQAVKSNVTLSISQRGEEITESSFSDMKYENNSAVIKNLKNEILSNEENVNESKSYIYFIASLTAKSPRNFDHAFVLHQFLRAKDKKVCYIRYQSWLERATLFDDLEKQVYGEECENGWTKEELTIFLKELSNLYGFQESKGSYEKCFGYSGNIHGSIFNFKDNVFSGKTLNYIALEVDPRDCLDHLATIIKSNSELEELFLKGI